MTIKRSRVGLIVALATVVAESAMAEIILRHGPGGAGSLFNSSLDSSVLLTSYSITRIEEGVHLSPAWGSLQSQGLAFSVVSATVGQLSEVASAEGLLFGPGESRSIGVPFALNSDANGDGEVDLNDFAIWKTHRDQVLYGPGSGDFDFSGVVDEVDFDYFLTEMGTAAVYTFTATSVVPEPSVFGQFDVFTGVVLGGVLRLTTRKRSRTK